MRRSLFFLIAFSFLLSCKNELPSSGYYFEEETSKVYKIDDKELVLYNFIDSLSSKISNYKLIENIGDSLLVINAKNEKENIYLKKLGTFKDKNSLKAKEESWFVRETNLFKQYLYFDTQGNIYAIFEPHDKSNELESIHLKYKGDFFNTFNVYEFDSFIIPIKIDSTQVTLFNIDYINGNKGNIITFNRVKTKPINKNIIGKWKATKNYKFMNFSTFFYYESKNRNRFKYIIPEDSIVNFLDYRNIEITKDYKLIRELNSKDVIIKDLQESPFSNLVFIRNEKVQFQYFDIISVSKDSLKIKLPVPDLKINYEVVKSN
ncbi:hypothetical protein [Tenacibaculum amylolyticum]|uniref:hypothetical protein n=1 Tax=Tenacibaculum amylolyticum TaxID=104269 RepID=UPI00389325BF